MVSGPGNIAMTIDSFIINLLDSFYEKYELFDDQLENEYVIVDDINEELREDYEFIEYEFFMKKSKKVKNKK